MDLVNDDNIVDFKSNQSDNSNRKKRKLKGVKTKIRIFQINQTNTTKDFESDVGPYSYNSKSKIITHDLQEPQTKTIVVHDDKFGDNRHGKNNVNVNIEAEVDPLEIELLDSDYIYGHKSDKPSKVTMSSPSFLSLESRSDSNRTDHKMDVYNQLKMSILNKDKMKKAAVRGVGNSNQMAYAPHFYNKCEEDWKAEKVTENPTDVHGDSKAFAFPNPDNFLQGVSGCCCDGKPPKSSCGNFNSRDLAYVFLFGIVVGLLAIIATSIVYSVFFVVKKSCVSNPGNPYEITLTRDHHYSDLEECKACHKCRKCCMCESDHSKRHVKISGKPYSVFQYSHSDVIPSSKWRLTPRNISCEAIGRVNR